MDISPPQTADIKSTWVWHYCWNYFARPIKKRITEKSFHGEHQAPQNRGTSWGRKWNRSQGVVALAKVHSCSTFEKTLASIHSIYKIFYPGDVGSDHLFHLSRPNLFHGEHTKYRIAWQKYMRHFVETTEVVDMVQFMIVDIKLIPSVLSLMDRDKEHIALIACYKIWPCKMFRERIFMTSRVTSLQARNDT